MNFAKTLRVYIIGLCLVVVAQGISFSQGTKEAELFGFAQKLFRDGIYDLAAEQFRQFQRDYPESERAGEAQFMVGEALYLAGVYASAASEFQVFLVRFPYHVRAKDAWHRMAQSHLALDRYSEAGTAFLQFQSRFSVDDRAPEALLQAAESFLQVKDSVRAKRAISLFFEEYPQSEHQWRAKLLRSRLYRLAAAPDSALFLLDEVITSQIKDLASIALLEKGQLLSEMGHYNEAVEAYSEVVKTYPQSTVVDQAQYQLGLLHYNGNNFERAIPPFKIIVETFPESDWYTTAQLYLAHALRESGDDSSAIEIYENCLTAYPDTCYQEAEYGLALSLVNVGRTFEALEKLDEVQHRFIESEYGSQAALKIGDVLLSLGNYEAAVEKYRTYILRHPEVGKSDQLQMTIGEIYEKRMGRFQRAADEYHRVLTDYPQSPLTYDALLAIGRCYEQLGDYSRARSAYEDVINTDPKSVFAERARMRIEWIDEFRVRDLEGATAELLSLLERAETGGSEDLTFRIAQVTFENLKDFERASEIMSDFLTEDPQSRRAAEAHYLMAQSYEKLSKKYAFEGNESLRNASLRKAENAYRRLRDGYPDSRWADDAELFLIEAEFGSVSNPDSATTRAMINRYSAFIEEFPRSDQLDRVHIQLGNGFMKLAEWDTLEAYDEAILHFEMVSRTGDEIAEAAYKIGFCHQVNGRYKLALDQFHRVNATYSKSPYTLDAQLGMAECYASLNQYSETIDAYRAIVYRYPQSQLARDVRVKMGDLFAQTGNYQKAMESYDRIFEQGYDLPPDLHYKMANVLRSLGKTKEAVAQYEAYLEADPGGEYIPMAYYGLARVQEQRGHLEEAAREYRRLIEEYPTSPSVVEAKGRLALVLYELGQYEEARTVCFNALTPQGDDSLKIELEAKVILASYRLGDLVMAETKAKEFKKAYSKQTNYLAQFDLEKGTHYLSARNGEDALLAFGTLLTDYPESPYVDDAQYGIGLTYLESGDFEKAVEAFRTVVQESPKSDLVPSVYLKLGNIYFLQMSFEDAAFAYRRVIDDERSGNLIPTAMFNLIRAYEAANRQDQALQVAKDLARQFPGYEDALRVRIKIGYLNAELGNYADAISALEDVLPDVDAEEETEVRYWIGESYYDSGKYNQALLEYLKVAYLSQAGGLWAVTAEFKAGQTYEALGRVDEAKRLYHRMIERYGTDSQWGEAAQERLRELEE